MTVALLTNKVGLVLFCLGSQVCLDLCIICTKGGSRFAIQSESVADGVCLMESWSQPKSLI